MARDEEQCHHIVHLNKIKWDFDIQFHQKIMLGRPKQISLQVGGSRTVINIQKYRIHTYMGLK